MKARKIIAIVFTCILVMALAACQNNQNQNSATSLPGGTPNTAGAGMERPDSSLPEDTVLEEDERSQADLNSGAAFEFKDDNVSIDLSLDRESYTVNDMVGLNITITNHAPTAVVYQKGSGSNRVPDGLQVSLGELTGMYQPVIATMDMQYGHLAPGESVTFEMPFAPYVATKENLLGPGLDQTLDWFTGNEDYAPAQGGEVQGSLSFTYQLMETESIEGPYTELSEGGNPHVIEGTFSTNLVEAA